MAEIENTFLWSLMVSFTLSTIFLASIRENTLGVYLSVFAFFYFGSSLVFRPRRNDLDFVGITLIIAVVVFVISSWIV